MKAQSELNATLKGNCELLEQLLLRSDVKEKKLAQKLLELNAEKNSEKRIYDENLAALETELRAVENKLVLMEKPRNTFISLKHLESELCIVSFELERVLADLHVDVIHSRAQNSESARCLSCCIQEEQALSKKSSALSASNLSLKSNQAHSVSVPNSSKKDSINSNSPTTIDLQNERPKDTSRIPSHQCNESKSKKWELLETEIEDLRAQCSIQQTEISTLKNELESEQAERLRIQRARAKVQHIVTTADEVAALKMKLNKTNEERMKEQEKYKEEIKNITQKLKQTENSDAKPTGQMNARAERLDDKLATENAAQKTKLVPAKTPPTGTKETTGKAEVTRAVTAERARASEGLASMTEKLRQAEDRIAQLTGQMEAAAKETGEAARKARSAEQEELAAVRAKLATAEDSKARLAAQVEAMQGLVDELKAPVVLPTAGAGGMFGETEVTQAVAAERAQAVTVSGRGLPRAWRA